MADKKTLGGYAGKLLRVDLTSGKASDERPDQQVLRQYVGGTGLGARYLYDEVPPGVEWSDPQNRLILASGPLGATRVAGSGTYSVLTKGPMTNHAGATQANGFFGAFLRFSGLDGLILQGAADRWVYLYVHDGTVEIRDAAHLLGKDTWQSGAILHQELGGGESSLSVIGIGPAGETGVRWATIAGDKGHVAAHNGVGAVLGSKRVKAIAVARGKHRLRLADGETLATVAKPLFAASFEMRDRWLYRWGTAGVITGAAAAGWLPVKNYTTNIFPEYERMDGRYLRTHFELKPSPCWACRMNHCHIMKVTEGPYAGYEGEEPEYEAIAAFGPAIGNTDPGGAVMLADLADRLGLDCNEAGWMVGWVMECYERGLLTKRDTDGLEMTWGNVEATKSLLQRTAQREGFGDLLAEGVRRACEQIGGEAAKLGIYTLKGATPRGHDHRGRWSEMLDTCTSGTSTIESTFGVEQPEAFGLPPVTSQYDWEQVSAAAGKISGRRQFEDCLGACRFCLMDYQLTLDAFNAATGLSYDIWEGMAVGRRISNLLRVFNLRHGLDPELERPSARYGSAPTDGPNQGTDIRPHWDDMVRNYRQHMGWEPATGKPLPETLRTLGLADLIPTVWGEAAACP